MLKKPFHDSGIVVLHHRRIELHSKDDDEHEVNLRVMQHPHYLVVGISYVVFEKSRVNFDFNKVIFKMEGINQNDGISVL